MSDKKKLKTLSFQDADIEVLVMQRMEQDESLSMAAAVRAVFADLNERCKTLQKDLEEKNHVISEMKDNEAFLGKEKWTLLEQNDSLKHENGLLQESIKLLQSSQLFQGYNEEAQEYMVDFYAELVNEGHYISPQMFILDLVRRVQKDAKVFIPNSGLLVQEGWICKE